MLQAPQHKSAGHVLECHQGQSLSTGLVSGGPGELLAVGSGRRSWIQVTSPRVEVVIAEATLAGEVLCHAIGFLLVGDVVAARAVSESRDGVRSGATTGALDRRPPLLVAQAASTNSLTQYRHVRLLGVSEAASSCKFSSGVPVQ